MTKKFMNLLSKWTVMAIALVAMMSVGLSSCDKSDDDDSDYNQITVTNNGTYTLQRFRIVFLNSSREKLTDKDLGTLAPGDKVSATIPTSAYEFYMATYLGNNWYFSPYYSVSYSNLKLSDAEVGEWTTN